MESISRQVIKKRAGVTIPVSGLKRKVFNPLLFFETELSKLDLVLNENEIELDGNYFKKDY